MYKVLDIEAVGEPWDGTGLVVGWGREAFPAPLPQHVTDELADPDIAKVVFTKFDHRWLRLRGIPVNGTIHDVQGMAWLLDEAQDLSLEACAKKYLGLEMDKRIRQMGGRLYFTKDDGTRVLLVDAPLDEVGAYCARDLEATERLYLELAARLREQGLYDYWLDERVPFTEVLAAMEARGVPVDIDGAKLLAGRLRDEMDELEAELRATAGLPEGFNLNSDKQLGLYLYSKEFGLPDALPIDAAQRDDLKYNLYAAVGLPVGFEVGKVGRTYVHGMWKLQGRGLPVPARTDSGQPSTAGPKLRAAFPDDEWVQMLLELKQRETIVTNFLDAFPHRGAGGRLYGRFNDTGTVTGRLSSNGPNLQNIPARTELGHRVRELFRPEPGTVFVHGDYGQLEPRLMAHFSGDPAMLAVYRDGAGDVYADMARGIFGESNPERRGICKTLVLAMSYGAGAGKVAMKLTESGYPTTEYKARGYLTDLKQHYVTFFAWREYVIDKAADEGGVSTIGGRPRRLLVKGERAQNWKEAEGHRERQAVNSIVQGSAADIVNRTMVRASRELPKLDLLVQVHDELLFEAPDEDIALSVAALGLIAEAGHGFELQVPLVFQPRVVRNWAEGKD